MGCWGTCAPNWCVSQLESFKEGEEVGNKKINEDGAWVSESLSPLLLPHAMHGGQSFWPVVSEGQSHSQYVSQGPAGQSEDRGPANRGAAPMAGASG